MICAATMASLDPTAKPTSAAVRAAKLTMPSPQNMVLCPSPCHTASCTEKMLTSACIYMYKHTHILTVYTCRCTCRCTCTYIHTYVHTYIHTHIHTYIHTYIHDIEGNAARHKRLSALSSIEGQHFWAPLFTNRVLFAFLLPRVRTVQNHSSQASYMDWSL